MTGRQTKEAVVNGAVEEATMSKANDEPMPMLDFTDDTQEEEGGTRYFPLPSSLSHNRWHYI